MPTRGHEVQQHVSKFKDGCWDWPYSLIDRSAHRCGLYMSVSSIQDKTSGGTSATSQSYPLGIVLPLRSPPGTSTNCTQRNSFDKEATFDFVSGDTQVVLNVGGQKFQTTAGVLCRDRFSLLAAICTTTPPITPDDNGDFFFERDW